MHDMIRDIIKGIIGAIIIVLFLILFFTFIFLMGNILVFSIWKISIIIIPAMFNIFGMSNLL
jgi:hypothetical protein